MRTTIVPLRDYLSSLVELIDADDKAAFVRLFVPLDCVDTENESGFLADLNEEGQQWVNLAAEIRCIHEGGAHTIDENPTLVLFKFEHPLLERCDREVGFVLTDGCWRAEG